MRRGNGRFRQPGNYVLASLLRSEADEAKFARMKTQKSSLLPSASQKRTVCCRPHIGHLPILDPIPKAVISFDAFQER